MKIESYLSRGVHVLAGSGDLALGSGDVAVVRTLDQAIAAGARFLVLDLSRLAWIDSSGIGAVVRCGKHAAEKGAVLKVVVASEGPVRKVFSVTRLDLMFEIFEDRVSAVGSFPA